MPNNLEIWLVSKTRFGNIRRILATPPLDCLLLGSSLHRVFKCSHGVWLVSLLFLHSPLHCTLVSDLPEITVCLVNSRHYGVVKQSFIIMLLVRTFLIVLSVTYEMYLFVYFHWMRMVIQVNICKAYSLSVCLSLFIINKS